ncbi:MAG: hypothetical protein KatS3mg012_2405 [Gaiellaceae bacterium]|jgi:uncharacterized membrane protein YfcA|nr:MAG: hypothetical protein KatS3mg012_2405 [Gaiellaceae bacterium]
MDAETLILVTGLFVLAILSGMLGLGVAFAAVPFLSLFMADLVHEVQPLSLLLNGFTAFAAAIGFARSGLVDWRRAGILAGATAVAAPVGALLAQVVAAEAIWSVYLAAVGYLAYRLFRPVTARSDRVCFRLAVLLAIPIAVLSGLLGVGPGFLLLPTLVLVGVEVKHAAAMNAIAVTPPSFTALIPHLSTAVWNPTLTVVLLVAGVSGSFVGARITSLYVPAAWVKQLFAILIATVTAYRVVTVVL